MYINEKHTLSGVLSEFSVVFFYKDRKCDFRVLVCRLYIKPSVVVVYCFAVSFQHQLADPSAVNAKVLARLFVMFHPVMKGAVPYPYAALSPHFRFLRLSVCSSSCKSRQACCLSPGRFFRSGCNRAARAARCIPFAALQARFSLCSSLSFPLQKRSPPKYISSMSSFVTLSYYKSKW